ncbi:MAG: ABC transporter substrate-binding protein [Desulfurococcales archaeon]|nr:ABC transporter substrate-binding protein [Desulfurococcales archaeon]
MAVAWKPVALAFIVLTIILAGALIVVWGKSSSAQEEVPEQFKLHHNQLEKIKERGVLIVGTSADWPPYEYVTPDGKFAGIDMILAQKIADALGVKLEIKDMKFAALFEAVQRGDVDIVIADVAMKPKRLQAVDFTIPYRCESGKAIVIKASDADSYNGYSWLEGKKIGVQLATTEQDLAKEYFGDKSEIVTFDRVYPEMTLSLKNGQIDAMIVAPDVAKIIVSKEKDLTIIDNIPFFSCSAVVVPQYALDLKQQVSQVIWDLKQSGEFDQIVSQEISKWLATQS